VVLFDDKQYLQTRQIRNKYYVSFFWLLKIRNLIFVKSNFFGQHAPNRLVNF